MFEIKNIKQFDNSEKITAYEFLTFNLKSYHIIALSTNKIEIIT